MRTSQCGRQLTLLANNAEHFIARSAAAADVEGAASAGSLAELSGSVGFAYTAGDASKGPGGLPGYLITKVGPFESAYEDLANGHLAKGEPSEHAAPAP